MRCPRHRPCGKRSGEDVFLLLFFTEVARLESFQKSGELWLEGERRRSVHVVALREEVCQSEVFHQFYDTNGLSVPYAHIVRYGKKV